MEYGRYVAPLDARAVVSHLGILFQFLGVALLPPVVVGLVAAEWLYAGVFAALAIVAYLAGRALASFRLHDLQLREAIVVTAVAYPLFSVAGAVAFLPHVDFLDGLFESMSGFTTTGLTVMRLGTVPDTLLFFRAYSQWLGGAGIVILSLAILMGPGRAAFHLYASEFGEESVAGNVRATARVVLRVYLALTGLGLAALLLAGMAPFDALLHVMTAISTGGFSPYADSIGRFDGPAVPAMVTLLMLLGAVSMPLYFLAFRDGPRRFHRDTQVRALVVLAALASLGMLVAYGFAGDAALTAVFHAVSALTGTGFSLEDPPVWPAAAGALGLALMFIGGAAGSTTGGVKLYRVLLMAKLAAWLVVRRVLPAEAHIPLKFGDVAVSDQELKEVLGFFALYVALFALGALVLVFGGFGLGPSLFESASALGTVGLSQGIAGPDLAAWGKVLLVLQMWVGRLEIIPVLVLLYPPSYSWRWAKRGG